jgi:ubiquinone/menaquinone biosynthesis C-methylase UbiE
MVPSPPDSAKQKAAIVESWNSVAPRWNDWAAVVDAWFRPATDRMMAALALHPGQSVLELAAGSGGFTRYLAEAVGPHGRVVATDSGPAMVQLATENARRAGWRQVEARVMDGDAPEVVAGTFDAVACRQGFMFFNDPDRAIERLGAALRPGGRLVVSVFTTPDRSPIIAIPTEILVRYTVPPGQPRPPPGGPGPFSLGEPGLLEGLFRSAKFTDVRGDRVSCPMRLGSASEFARFFREIVLGRLEELAPEDRDRAIQELTDRAAPFADPTGSGGPCELLVVSGLRPS